ncbi:MAG TPA: hypothetical protein VEI83_12230 [Acidimicrobiales bacterium]|nr:hypothetical protein [Acidimicrobiales bacterium]
MAETDASIRLAAADCAEHVLPLFEDRFADRGPRIAIEAARGFAHGTVSADELSEANGLALEVATAITEVGGAHAAARAAAQAAAPGDPNEALWATLREAEEAVLASRPTQLAKWCALSAEQRWQRDRLMDVFIEDARRRAI